MVKFLEGSMFFRFEKIPIIGVYLMQAKKLGFNAIGMPKISKNKLQEFQMFF